MNKSVCKKFRQSKEPKCNDQPNCIWVKGTGCVSKPEINAKETNIIKKRLQNLNKMYQQNALQKEQNIQTFLKKLNNMKTHSINKPISKTSTVSINQLMLLNLLKSNKHICTGYWTDKNRTRQSYSRGMPALSELPIIYMTSKGDFIDLDFKSIIEALIDCKQKNKILVFYIILRNDPIGAHANMLIFNHVRNEVERFEPHGIQTNAKGYNSKQIDKSLVKLTQSVNSLLNTNYKYLNSYHACPMLPGVQKLEGSFRSQDTSNTGWCATWSILYGDLRLQLPDVSSYDILQLLMKHIKTSPQILREFIRGQHVNMVKDFSHIKKRMTDVNMNRRVKLMFLHNPSIPIFPQEQYFNKYDDIVSYNANKSKTEKYSMEQFVMLEKKIKTNEEKFLYWFFYYHIELYVQDELRTLT